MGLHAKTSCEETSRADNNREKSMSAIRHFHRLLGLAADPRFCGTIAVEVSAKNGRYGKPKLTLVEYDRDTSDC
jgi:hypothetical protein